MGYPGYPAIAQPKWELCSYSRHKVKYVCGGCKTKLPLDSEPVPDIFGRDVKGLLGWGGRPIWERKIWVSVFLQMMCFCWLQLAVTFSMHCSQMWSGQMKSGLPSLRTWFSAGNCWIDSSGLGEEFEFTGILCLWVMGKWSIRWTDWLEKHQGSVDTLWGHWGEDVPVSLHFNPQQ